MEERLEDIGCVVCGARDRELFLPMDGYAYQKCGSCGLVYQSPRPVFDDLRKRYGEGYFDYEIENQENFFTLMKFGLRDIGLDRIFGSRISGKRRFLDIGCATGLLLNHMKKKGWETKGVEVCARSASYAIENFGLDIFIGTIEEAGLPDNAFDVVHFSHLIEHVPDPPALLDEVKRIVKPGGHIICTTPNVDGLQARVAKDTWRSAIPDHIFLFSRKTLRKLLESKGYNILKQISWGGIPVGKRPGYIKKPADRFAKLFNFGDVMLFHCTPA